MSGMGRIEMGQYFLAVNETRREFIHPHRFGGGLKFMEFSSSGSGFLAGLAVLLRDSHGAGFGDLPTARKAIVGSWAKDKVSIVGDYNDSGLYGTAEDTFTDVSLDVMEVMIMDPHTKAILKDALSWKWAIGNERDMAEYKQLFGDIVIPKTDT